MLDLLIGNFTQFFSMASWVEIFSTPSAIMMVLSLILLEGILSSDNAVVLAVMVKHLPPTERKKALTYGMLGAYAFRFIAIMLGTFLVKFWQIKIIGGGYLLYLAYKHFTKNGEDHVNGAVRSFWVTVAMVEAMDIVFSADSILAALGVSEKVVVLFLGGVFGIIMMRFAAMLFIKLLEKFPELEHAAYVLIAIIGAKLLASVAGYHLPEFAFVGALLGVFGGTMIWSGCRNRDAVAA